MSPPRDSHTAWAIQILACIALSVPTLITAQAPFYDVVVSLRRVRHLMQTSDSIITDADRAVLSRRKLRLRAGGQINNPPRNSQHFLQS